MAVSMVPEIVPLRDLQSRLLSILDRLRQGPVVLTSDDMAAAVMVEPETWNNLLAELEDLRDTLDALGEYESYQKTGAGRPWREIRSELVQEGRLDG
ncbi:MAG: type II toxin-antitoxin system Phd/YefM family antitoxin [Anaerolineae bacterium]|nr:type II toxin-antitoxin system Phd/YefM family antitoxin [Anaerolineae bacterium]